MLAGWVSGAAVAFATTAIVLVWLSRNDGWRLRFSRTTLRLPLVGLILGAATLWTDQPGFTVAVVVILALGLLMWVTLVGRPGWAVLSTAAVVLASFGGLLPFLASV